GGLRFPLRVIRDLAVGGEGPVIVLFVGIEDSTAALVDIGLRGGHPVSGKVRLTVRSANHRSSRSCRSATAAATTAPTACGSATRGTALRRRLAGQQLGEHQ